MIIQEKKDFIEYCQYLTHKGDWFALSTLLIEYKDKEGFVDKDIFIQYYNKLISDRWFCPYYILNVLIECKDKEGFVDKDIVKQFQVTLINNKYSDEVCKKVFPQYFD